MEAAIPLLIDKGVPCDTSFFILFICDYFHNYNSVPIDPSEKK